MEAWRALDITAKLPLNCKPGLAKTLADWRDTFLHPLRALDEAMAIYGSTVVIGLPAETFADLAKFGTAIPSVQGLKKDRPSPHASRPSGQTFFGNHIRYDLCQILLCAGEHRFCRRQLEIERS